MTILKKDYRDIVAVLAKETELRTKAEDMYKDLIFLTETTRRNNAIKDKTKTNIEEHNSVLEEDNEPEEESEFVTGGLFTEVVRKRQKKANAPKQKQSEEPAGAEDEAVGILVEKCKCSKCPKPYETMEQIRRHEYRSHKIVECYHCGNSIRNRVELQRHKEKEHRMTKVPTCKYFQEGRCLDSEECLYNHNKQKVAAQAHESRAQPAHAEHVQSVKNRSSTSKCRNGPSCNDPDNFGASGHLLKTEVKCRFQESCYKETCQFKHTAQRESFLEEDKSSKQVK